jgi:hypothetical protein
MKNKTVSQDFYKEISAAVFCSNQTTVNRVVKTIYFVDCPNTMMLWKKLNIKEVPGYQENGSAL